MMTNRLCSIVLFCLLTLTFVTSSFAAEATGQVSGEIEQADPANCRGMVSLWPANGSSAPDPQTSDAVPSWANELNADCSFSLEADPGNYFLRVTLRRSSGSDLGPTRKGDLIYLSPDAQGQSFPVKIQSGQPINIGRHANGWEFPGYSKQIKTGIVGQVTDINGAPVSGLFVQAFADQSLENSLVAVSATTDSDGQFQLRFDRDGKYYLQAREEFGESGVPIGRLVGVYGNKKAKAVKVKTGEVVDNIQIEVALRQPGKAE